MKRLLCAVLTAGVAVGTAGAAFTDIAGHWGEQAITQIVERNIFNGTSETTFSPNDSMTRAMFVTVLGRCAQALGFSTEGQAQMPFTDVPSEAYYASYVAWANANEIVKGMDDTHFAPDEAVTREQMCTLLIRFFSYLKLDTTSYAPTKPAFADADQISAYASESVSLAHSMGLIQGIPQGDSVLMSPRGAVTRAQVATVIGRVLTETEGKVTPPETPPTTPEQPNPPSDTNTGGGGIGGGASGGGGTGGGGTGGGGASGGGTSGGSSNSGTELTPEQKKEEEKVAGLLTNLLSNYQTSRYLGTMNQAPKDCAAILMDCIAKALEERKKGQILTSAWIQTTYQTQIQSFKDTYRALEKEDKDQLANLIVRLESTENIYTIMAFFGVSLSSV